MTKLLLVFSITSSKRIGEITLENYLHASRSVSKFVVKTTFPVPR